MKNCYAGLSPPQCIAKPNREEATGTQANHHSTNGPSIIVIGTSSIIVITLSTCDPLLLLGVLFGIQADMKEQ